MKEKDFKEKFEIMRKKHESFRVVAIKQGREIVIMADSYKILWGDVVGLRRKGVATGTLHLKDVEYFEFADERLY